MPTLDVSNANQVSSPQVLDVFLGVPQSHLLIFTGIAIPEFASDGSLDDEQVIVKLGKTISNPQIPFQYSATVGLASIGNADSDYTFATDDVSVIADPQSGELQLVCDIAAQGSSILQRFSYQATVIVQTTVPSISGSIFWRKSVASAVPQFANNLFTVQASIQLPKPPGQFAPVFQRVADGTVIYPAIPAATTFLPDGLVVSYVIENALVNTDLYIICNPVDGAFQNAGSVAGTLQCAVLENPSPINLKPPNLHTSGVDFILVPGPPPPR
jgi:hypothetical protein